MRVGLALGEGSPPGVGALFPTPGEPGQALFVPVVVVNVGAVEAVDDGGGVVEGFGRLEDGEGNAGAAARVGEPSRVDSESDMRERLGEREKVDPDFPDAVPGADVERGGRGLPGGTAVCGSEFEGDVADAGTPVGDAELASARGDALTILAAHARNARTNLRLRRLADAPLHRHYLTCFLLQDRRLTSAGLRHPCRVHNLILSFIRLRVAEQDTTGRPGNARLILAGVSSYPCAPATRCARLDHGAGIPP